MPNVVIRRPRIEDIKELTQFFRIVITDTFTLDGIGDKVDDMENEIEEKKSYLKTDFMSNGVKRYFLIALDGDKIIGSIEHGPVSELIRKCTDYALTELNEVGTVFVHPDYQRNGIGNLLLNIMYLTLKEKGIEEFCLDSGYRRAQEIWRKKFGAPDYLLTDYWDKEYHHMIWRIQIKDLLI